jgi:GT2 family glycosyltransferase
MHTLKVSVVIPVFNNLNFTKACLKNLYLQKNSLPKHSQLNIVLVDDGSTDGTFDWVKDNYPEVQIIRGDGSLWWSGGVNLGTRFALEQLKTDFVLWWNNDIVCADHYFESLFSILRTKDAKIIVGSKIFVLGQDVIWGMGGKFDPKKGTKFMYGERKPDSEEFKKTITVDWFPGMGTCFHKSVYEKIGYVDEINFPQYHGDSDFTFRAKKAGFNLIAFPELIIYNDNSNTGTKHSNSFRKLYLSITGIKSNYNLKKNILFLKKHSASPRAYLLLLRKYFRYIGGFLKWKLMSWVGIKKGLQ